MKLSDLILDAKQVGTLYHYTSPRNWENIKKTNKLEAGDPVGDPTSDKRRTYPKDISFAASISFTRNKSFHKLPYFEDLALGATFGKINGLIRITVDGDKLSQNYKLVPYRWAFSSSKVNPPGKYGDEYETRALTYIIEDFDKYFIKADDVYSEYKTAQDLEKNKNTSKFSKMLHKFINQ